jgi:hypothetical protein
MELDGDLPRGAVLADPFDDGLDRLQLPGTIRLFPLGGIKDSALRFPDPPQYRCLDSALGKRFGGTRRPARPCGVEEIGRYPMKSMAGE